MAASAQQQQASQDVKVLVTATPAAGAPAVVMNGLQLGTIEHASASPCGQMVVVGRTASPTPVQVSMVTRDGRDWSRRVAAGQTGVPALPLGAISTLLGPPVLSNCGELLVMANVTSVWANGTPSTTPALVRIMADGSAQLQLRFNSTAGPGVPASGMVMFGGPISDAWRLGGSGATFTSRSTGLFGSNGLPGVLQPLTSVLQQGATAGTGMAMTVTSVGEAATSGVGHSAQRISTGAYGREDLSGLVMFSPEGVGEFAVRDRTTPIAGLPGQFVLSSSPQSGAIPATMDVPGSRVGINSAGTLSFVGRFGVPPVSTGGINSPPPPVTGTLGVFTKAVGQPSQLVAAANAPVGNGLDGWRYLSFGNAVLNARGTLAFTATVQGTAGTRSAVFTTTDAGTPRLLAWTGATSGPGSPPAALGGAFTSFVTEPSINRLGQVVFQARLSGGTTTEAVVGYDPSLGGLALLTTGTSLDVPGLGARTVTLGTVGEIGGRALAASGNDDGLPTVLTDDGTAIVRAGLSGLGTAVLTATVPTVHGACCTGSACIISAMLACEGDNHRFVGTGTSCYSARPGMVGCCPADFDQNGAVSTQDLFGFVNAWITRDAMADFDANGSVSLADLTGYIGEFTAGCAGSGGVTLRPGR
jgi:hypothetical protein